MRFQCVGSKKHLEVGVNTYRVQYEIARGGFSTIYLAKHLVNKKKYALKKIYAHSQLEVSRIRREIYSHYTFGSHDNIMKIHGVYRERYGEGASMFWLVIDYCPIGSLQDVLYRTSELKESLPEKDVVDYLSQLCSALDYMHNHSPSIAHRDVKPGNCLLRRENHLVVTDFGSAVVVPVEVITLKDSQALKDEAAELCTMPYRAPELFNCEPGLVYDSSVDVWSSGCVLHALCFHASPFDVVAARGDSIALAVLSYKFTPPPKTNYTDGLMSLLKDMVAVNPQERPSCSRILDRLQSLKQ